MYMFEIKPHIYKTNCCNVLIKDNIQVNLNGPLTSCSMFVLGLADLAHMVDIVDLIEMLSMVLKGGPL